MAGVQMKLYTGIIGGGLAIIATINLLLGTFTPLSTILWVLTLAIACGLIDGVVTLTIHLMPQKMFSPDKRCYEISDRQQKLYKRLKVKQWKAYVPDLGQFCKFKKNKIQNPKDPNYLYKFLVENCYADVLHTISAYFGFFVMLIAPNGMVWTVAFPIAIINFIINIMPAMIQKYMRPRLISLYNRVCEPHKQINVYSNEEEVEVENDNRR